MSTGQPQERRRHRRLELAFPIRFSAAGPPGRGIQGRGLTRDVSAGGLRFETDLAHPPPRHSEITVHITIPAQVEKPDSPVFLSGRATVLRCRPLVPGSRRHTGARWSVAARFETHPDISLPTLDEFPLGPGGPGRRPRRPEPGAEPPGGGSPAQGSA
ncbi:MAG: PilZ domain-containing protein [Candidatus Brocadiia bacterium]